MNTQRNAELMQDLARSPRFNLFSLKDHATVRAAVAQLQGHEHTVILMRFWEQNTISEIANILDLSWREVESYLSQAMATLKRNCLDNSHFSRSDIGQPKLKQAPRKSVAA